MGARALSTRGGVTGLQEGAGAGAEGGSQGGEGAGGPPTLPGWIPCVRAGGSPKREARAVLVMGVLGQAWPLSGAPEAFLRSPSPGFLDWPFIRGVNTTPFPRPHGPGLRPQPDLGGGSQGLGVRAPGLGPLHHPKGHAGQDLSFPARAWLSDLTTPTPTPKKSFPGIWGGLFEMLTTRMCIRYYWEERLFVSPRPTGL